MISPEIKPAATEAPLPKSLPPGQGPGSAPSPGMLALRHIGLRLGITILIAGAIQLIGHWSAG